jgi:hypothetical protein
MDESDPDPGDPIKFDLANAPDASEPESLYCDDVNIIIVVDDSASMSPYQQKLAMAMPGFIEALSTFLDGIEEAHVLVTSTGDIRHSCQQDCQNPNACDDVNPPGEDMCDPNTYDKCHDKLGAGVTRPVGNGSSNTQCIPVDDGRFIDWFSLPLDKARARLECAMTLGAEGSIYEQPIGAAVGAIAQSGPGLCNEGFALEDAPWLFILLTDEDDHTDDEQGDPEQIPWLVDNLRTLTGDPSLDTVAIIGIFDLFPDNNSDCAPASNVFDKPARLLDWMSDVENKHCGDIEGDLEFVLHDSLEAIQSACLAAAN